MKMIVKKFFIWLFNLNNLSEIIKYERDKQKNLDKKYYETLLKEKLEIQANEFSYERSSLQYDIKTLEEEIFANKKREKEVNEKELRAKKQINANVHVATKIYSRINEASEYIAKKTAEIHGIMDEALGHKKEVEKLVEKEKKS